MPVLCMGFDQFFQLVWVYCLCAVIRSVGYTVEMTRPTTARLLAMKACDVNPGLYSYLLTGQAELFFYQYFQVHLKFQNAYFF